MNVHARLRFADRGDARARRAFTRIRTTELAYASKLRKIARHIGDMAEDIRPDTMERAFTFQILMQQYAKTLEPWANKVGEAMVAEINARNKQAWEEAAARMGRNLQLELRTHRTGETVRQLMADQVELITSLPIEAAKRVHQLTLKGITEGARAKEIADEIFRTGEVTESRAMLIARTEVARTASVLTQSRAKEVGSEEYIWRTVKDGAVRKSHKEMEGRVCRWDSPPKLSDGTVTHAGQIYNCRCHPEPIIPGV